MKTYNHQTFEKLDIQEVQLEDLHFTGCTFVHCNFYGLTLTSCFFTDCTFRGCSVAAITWKVSELNHNHFHSCKLIGIDWNLLWRKSGLYLPFATLDHCMLFYNSFVNMKLCGFDFQQSSFHGGQFDRCDLRRARLQGCTLKEVVFTDNQLDQADFRDAREYDLSLKRNTLKKARFSFPEVLNLLAESGIEIE